MHICIRCDRNVDIVKHTLFLSIPIIKYFISLNIMCCINAPRVIPVVYVMYFPPSLKESRMFSSRLTVLTVLITVGTVLAYFNYVSVLSLNVYECNF